VGGAGIAAGAVLHGGRDCPLRACFGGGASTQFWSDHALFTSLQTVKKLGADADGNLLRGEPLRQ